MKMTLNKLIANDIINYGMSQTSGFDYSVFLESYIDDFDLEGRNYIYNNLEEICDAISKNENISYFNYNKETKEFDMVFYWNNLMNDTEKYVYEILTDLKDTDRFELDDIREIAMDLLYDDSTKNLTIEKIRNSKKKEYDI